MDGLLVLGRAGSLVAAELRAAHYWPFFVLYHLQKTENGGRKGSDIGFVVGFGG